MEYEFKDLDARMYQRILVDTLFCELRNTIIYILYKLILKLVSLKLSALRFHIRFNFLNIAMLRQQTNLSFD